MAKKGSVKGARWKLLGFALAFAAGGVLSIGAASSLLAPAGAHGALAFRDPGDPGEPGTATAVADVAAVADVGEGKSCVLPAEDRTWIESALVAWADVSRDDLRLTPEPLPWMLLFDEHCVWHLQPDLSVTAVAGRVVSVIDLLAEAAR
ncbi:MAG: hypothetical protein ABI639_12480 [Thermoanaerobaculia bacterium]